MGAGPLVLGTFLLVALWVPGRAITLVALVAASLCWCAALMIAIRESFIPLSTVLLYTTALVAYFVWALRKVRQKALPRTPDSSSRQP